MARKRIQIDVSITHAEMPFNGIHFDGEDMFVIREGVRIAKRGHPGTAHAGKWISLEPGFSIYDDPAQEAIVIEYKGVRVN
jgi:hypothetical protein